MVAGLCCCPKQNWSTLPGSWSSFAPKPVSEKLTRGDPSPCSRVVGFGAQFQAVHVEDGWQDGGAQPHIDGRDGELLSFHHSSSQPLLVLPLSLCSFLYHF